MKSIGYVTATLLLIVAILSAILGIISWPPGGLMFALPYVFFIIAMVFGGIGVLLLLVRRLLKRKQ